MIHGTSIAILAIPSAAVAGLVLGFVYFAALRRTVDLYSAGHGWILPTSLTLARLAGAVAVFAAVAWLGAAPLLAASLGFLAARAVMLRSARRAG